MQIYLPQSIEFIIETLEKSGFEAYIVGGSVRDFLLGKKPTDFDVCTSALPDDITDLFEKTVPTGIKHGTVTVLCGGLPVEVTTFRTDGVYNDFRHPDNVKFVSDLKTDLARRDFTVNAMCYSNKTGIIDLFGGIDDLKSRTLRAVDNPDKRFKEDALRILRLFRFSSTLGFNIESKTLLAATSNTHLLKNVSVERIREELIKLSCGINPSAVLPLIEYGGLEFLNSGEKLSEIPFLPENERLRVFAFLKLASGNLKETLDYLKCSNAFKQYAEKMDFSLSEKAESRSDIKHILRVLEEDIYDLLSYKSVIFKEDVKDKKRVVGEILENREPYKISQLAVTGSDITAKGYRGNQVGETLEKLLQYVIENPSLNKKEKLINLI